MQQIVKHCLGFRESVIVPERGRVVPKSMFARFAAWLLSMTQHEIVVDTQKETVSYRSVQVDDVRSLIMCVMDHTGWQKVLNCEVDRIVVGHDLYMKILQSELERPFCVISEVPLRNGTTGTKICGIDVQFVPWIEGFAIIPKKEM